MRRFLIGFVLVFSVGCVSPAAIKAIDTGIAANEGHMRAMKGDAFLVAQDNFDFLHQIKFNLVGSEMPAATAARVASRQAAEKKAEEAAAAKADK